MRLVYGSEPIQNVQCPLCLATSGRVLYSVTPEESARQFIRPGLDRTGFQELAAVIQNLWRADQCWQVRCDACNAVFAWPHQAGDGRFYNLAFREHMRYPQKRWEFFAAVRFVDAQASGPVLELGAGDGAFVRILRAAGVSASAINVVEYSDQARKDLAAIDPGLKVFSDLEQFAGAAEPNSCSHVFAFQVLEHVQEPVEHLRTFRRLLREKGLLCLAVPNPGRIEANERNGLLLDLPPCHVTRFTVPGVAALARHAGFELIHSEVEPVVLKDWFWEFLSYHFKRRIQYDGTIQNRLERMLPWRFAALGGGLLALPAALLRATEAKQGGSLFCVLRATD